jgi:hypothetical protein
MDQKKNWFLNTVALTIESKAFYKVGKCSITQWHSQPKKNRFLSGFFFLLCLEKPYFGGTTQSKSASIHGKENLSIKYVV